MIRSIRFRLTLWYIGILAVILVLLGWALYVKVTTRLSQDIDGFLALQADRVADSIFVFWEAKQTAIRPSQADKIASAETLEGEIQQGRFFEWVSRWAYETGELQTMRPIRLLDKGGRVLIASFSFTKLALPVMADAVAHAQKGRTFYETFELPDHRIRLITRPIVDGDRLLYLVQAVTSLREMDTSLAQIRLWLFWLIPTTLVVTSAIGWFLATLALRPVGSIITQVQRMGAENISKRIQVPRTGDELERLAATFNEMLERLERAFQRLRQFSAAASHELRTPLTVMKGELEVALRKPRDSEEYQRVLRIQLEVINEMTSIVEALLALARIEGGGRAVEYRPVELGALALQVRDSWRAIAQTKDIHVDVQTDGAVWVNGERRLLERLLSNLLDNALKHTPDQGSVMLQVKSDGPNACMIVKDTGPGIPPEELPKIFERFFSRRSTADDAPSTGLGLGLCRWIAEAHQGRIEVSNQPGQGATFTVFLTLTTSPA